MAAEKAPPVPPEEPQVVITEDNLTGLPFFRNLIEQMVYEWKEDQGDEAVVSLISAIQQVFRDPLISFDKAYATFSLFCTSGDTASPIGEMWRVLQMMICTELGNELEKILTDFVSLVRRIMHDSPSGPSLKLTGLYENDVAPPASDIPRALKLNISYVLLLAIRFYIRGKRLVTDPPKEEGGQ